MKIEYDTHKNAINIRKHGLSFTTATTAFADPSAVIEFDDLHSVHEDRYNLIGAVESHILFIVYTMRGVPGQPRKDRTMREGDTARQIVFSVLDESATTRFVVSGS